MHERTDDGRDRHFFQKIGKAWVCDCGEVRDRLGRTVDGWLEA